MLRWYWAAGEDGVARLTRGDGERKHMARRSRSQLLGSTLYPVALDGTPLAPIAVNSADWYAWLAHPETRSFQFPSPYGSVTVVREQRKRGAFWYAYGSIEGKLHKTYLGRSQALDLEGLQAAARRLSLHRPSPERFLPRRAELHFPTLEAVETVSRELSDLAYSLENGGTLRAPARTRLLAVARQLAYDLEVARQLAAEEQDQEPLRVVGVAPHAGEEES